MESLRDIRQNIKAIKSTQQIMQTMKMISSARIRKAQEAMQNARPFAQKMLLMVDDLKMDILSMPANGEEAESWPSRFFVNKTGNPDKVGLICITGDKGWAGSFNAVILLRVLQFLKENQGKEIKVFAIGKKGRDFLARLKMAGLEIGYGKGGVFPKGRYGHAELVGGGVIEGVFQNQFGAVTAI